MTADPLRVRLFGYGVPCRVRLAADGAVLPLPTDAPGEARALARQLRLHRGLAVAPTAAPADEADVWCLSMPLGRAGLNGLPHEHLKIYGFAEARLEVLDAEGYREVPLRPGETARVVPGMVLRLRARPLPGMRVLVAYQTEDRTPLQGNAAPFSLDGQVPEAYDARLRICHAAFDQVRVLATEDRAGYARALEAFFERMRQRLAADPQIAAAQEVARAQGTYGLADQEPLFARQEELLTPERIDRIEAGDPELFRFPGMFGGISPLFTQVR